MGRPQHTFCAIATFPHFGHLNPGMIAPLTSAMVEPAQIVARAAIADRVSRHDSRVTAAHGTSSAGRAVPATRRA